MKTLLIAVGLFFFIFGGSLVYFSVAGTGHEYDLKFALPIDTRKMPKVGPPPEIVSQLPDDTANPIVDGRAEARTPPAPAGHPVQFLDRDGTASERPVR
jgi:hypothetical protein